MQKLIALCLFAFISIGSASGADGAREKQVVIQIKEMTCQLCAYLVNKELRNIDGVITTKADLKTRSVSVSAQDKVSDEQLIQAIDKLHYTPQILRTE
ncbi:mercuric ion binding protein [Mesocricetibacter intestinalis]|uniref:Mercuric ion binding protein n=1 Tax=Mesocricetibacter intestinalis TaxID=1521930 RepID=A0A4R6VFT0_9PAST|nr:heavy-metal-associated domain-containing protein [Mesocricetibacter intestinalis]TDQ59631.1 mercuric ion binding protein [Mesocricetibacter intestinalis]